MRPELAEDLARWERGELRIDEVVDRHPGADHALDMAVAHAWVSFLTSDVEGGPGPSWEDLAARLPERTDESPRRRPFPTRRVAASLIATAVMAAPTNVAADSGGVAGAVARVKRKVVEVLAPVVPAAGIEVHSLGAPAWDGPAVQVVPADVIPADLLPPAVPAVPAVSAPVADPGPTPLEAVPAPPEPPPVPDDPGQPGSPVGGTAPATPPPPPGDEGAGDTGDADPGHPGDSGAGADPGGTGDTGDAVEPVEAVRPGKRIGWGAGVQPPGQADVAASHGKAHRP